MLQRLTVHAAGYRSQILIINNSICSILLVYCLMPTDVVDAENLYIN